MNLMISSSFFLLTMSKALLMSMPSISMVVFTLLIFAINYLCAQTASAVLLLIRKPLWLGDKYFSAADLIRLSAYKESTFLIEFNRTIGLRLGSGTFGLPGLLSTTSVPLSSPRTSLFSIALLSISASCLESSGGPYLSSSPGMASGPAAQLLFRLFIASRTSLGWCY